MMSFRLIITCILLVTAEAFSQNSESLIYGKILMRDGDIYQGVIRWNDDEALWDDTFNARKIDNPYEKYLEREDFEEIEDEDRVNFFGFKFKWSKRRRLVRHQFVTFFGDIHKIQVDGRSHAILIMKNGEKFELEKNGEDIGSTVYVLDEKEGRVKLKWRKIREIEFLETPENVRRDFGAPLYAKVISSFGDFEGSIQWEEGEEGLDTDELDGEDRDSKRDEKISFSEIKSIEFISRRYSLVELRNGEKLELGGTNDVDKDHRGLVIKDPRYGWIKMKRRDIDKVIFLDKKEKLLKYTDFKETKELSGLISLEDGSTLKGRIVYDMDESLDFEHLDGKYDDVEYKIPFRNIKKIIPKNRHSSDVILRNNIKLRLEDSQDVNRRNTGLLIWAGDSDEPRYISWRKIREIEFD